MIARIWHGITPASKADEYVEYINKTGIRDYRATAGNWASIFYAALKGIRRIS